MRPKLELRQIHKRYGSVDAVKSVSLALHRGEFFSLLGPSGCGKSTTLSMIAGFLRPDGGEIIVDGAVVNDLPPQRRSIGLVFQDYAVFTSLSVRTNLEFGLRVKRTKRAERRRLVESFASQLDLVPLLGRRGASLNMSEMQRVALARVLITQPELLLLDEPMSNLDANVRAKLRGELRQVQKALGQTVFYVTHDQAEALSMSDRIGVMHDGRLLQVATPEEIYRNPVDRFVAEFIGDPPINVIVCEVCRDGARLKINVPGWLSFWVAHAAIEPGRHWLAIRPHDIAIRTNDGASTLNAPVKFVENFGSEHILHVQYLGDLIRVVVPPRSAAAGDTVRLQFDPTRAHLIDRGSEKVVQLTRLEAAA